MKAPNFFHPSDDPERDALIDSWITWSQQAFQFTLFPGAVHSKTDHDVHFITARQLADLYKVSMNRCRILDRNMIDDDRQWQLALAKTVNTIHLRPRYHGDYVVQRILYQGE